MLRGAVGQKGLQELPSAAAGLAVAKGLSPVACGIHWFCPSTGPWFVSVQAVATQQQH